MATIRYLWILANQRPMSIGVDENHRVMFSMNFRTAVDDLLPRPEESLAAILTTAGLITLGVDTFIGRLPNIPPPEDGDPDTPFTNLSETGGIEPVETHTADKYRQPSFQIIVRALGEDVAHAKALTIWETLDGLRDVTVNY